ncbi:MAG: FAD-dependent oxidoreductase [Candidatus Marinimicrobia bacterium]|nr:FAD-dependent oxidoreductase [Candidatus Neomarinimicrobiota bacterium]
MLKVFIESRRKYEAMFVDKTLNFEPTDAMKLGTALHTLLLEPEKIDEVAVRIPGLVLNDDGHRKGNPWKQWKAEQPKAAALLTSEEWSELKEQAEVVWSRKRVRALLENADAMEESLFLIKHATKVTILHRRDKFRSSKIMQDRILTNKKISVMWDTVVEEVLGDGNKVNAVKIKNVKTNEVSKLTTDAMFLAIGHIPNTKFAADLVELDEQGYIKADNTKTKVPGLFAAGDCVDRIYKQAVTAAGTGCMAALDARRILLMDDNENNFNIYNII